MSWLKDCEICNTGLCKAVDERKEKGMSERAACRDMSGESEGLYSEDAIYSRYRYYTGKIKRVPCESHTDESVKTHLDQVVMAFVKDEITDDDAKRIIDLAANKVNDGTFAKRVGTKMAAAIKKVNKSRKPIEVKETDNYQRLLKHVSGTTNGLQLLVDGAIPKPENEEEAEAAICIKAALPNLCLLIARLGIDLIEINEIFLGRGASPIKLIADKKDVSEVKNIPEHLKGRIDPKLAKEIYG